MKYVVAALLALCMCGCAERKFTFSGTVVRVNRIDTIKDTNYTFTLEDADHRWTCVADTRTKLLLAENHKNIADLLGLDVLCMCKGSLTFDGWTFQATNIIELAPLE